MTKITKFIAAFAVAIMALTATAPIALAHEGPVETVKTFTINGVEVPCTSPMIADLAGCTGVYVTDPATAGFGGAMAVLSVSAGMPWGGCAPKCVTPLASTHL